MNVTKAKDTLHFYIIVGVELLFSPILFLWEFFKKKLSSDRELNVSTLRKEVVNPMVYINVHEWGGYPLKRAKEIRTVKKFECGLQYQLERFAKPSNRYSTFLSVTLSDAHMHNDYEYIKKNTDQIIKVPNEGMDFSGYSVFYNSIKEKGNSYVILTNSSVNRKQIDFLDDYIDYMENNKDVGILGVSGSSKMYQTFISNNFTPHLQSFFYLTTTDVLNELVKKNNGKFPGVGITHKLLLIRKAEIKTSKMILGLGYNLSLVLENGKVFKFGRANRFDNGFKRWKLGQGDMRSLAENPNMILPINKQNLKG